jgi:uncharacterized protein GlcG (DUF336 family)
MRNLLIVILSIGLLSMGAAIGQAQDVVTQHNLSLGLAKTIAEAALAECKAKAYHTTVAVVDRAGQLLVLLRDEEAGPQTVEMARRKAYTARMFRMSTQEFQKRTTPDQPLAGQRDISDMLALSGGVPIQIGTDPAHKETIGAVGSSGSSLEMDDACAKAGIARVADKLK